MFLDDDRAQEERLLGGSTPGSYALIDDLFDSELLVKRSMPPQYGWRRIDRTTSAALLMFWFSKEKLEPCVADRVAHQL